MVTDAESMVTVILSTPCCWLLAGQTQHPAVLALAGRMLADLLTKLCADLLTISRAFRTYKGIRGKGDTETARLLELPTPPICWLLLLLQQPPLSVYQ